MQKNKKRLKITHNTVYEFSDEVYIEPHYIRLSPGISSFNKLVSAEITINPSPSGFAEESDAENNRVHFCWFSGMHSKLIVSSESVVILQDKSPFNFIVFPDNYSKIPFDYSPHLHDNLHANLFSTKIDQPLIDFGNQILEKSSNETLPFITNLTNQIYEKFKLESRQEGNPYEADKTFLLKIGSCRDLSWMQIQLLRHFGIAARFVSGYFYIESQDAEHELHGWLEAYLPGAGWVGFDPSHGILAGNTHIPICSSAQYQNTMPITGSFRGDADSTLQTTLNIEKI